ncbi:MAG: carbonic anhydrase [Alphaproteobacteria bacterium]
MKSLEMIIQGYHNFHKNFQAGNDHGLNDLSDSQQPKIMVITCCDSRVKLETLFGVNPGDLFIVRNVANVVPPRENDDGRHGVSAALEFAVRGLGVKHIIVMGHSNCGGIKALRSGKSGFDYVDSWMSHIREANDRIESLGADVDVQQEVEYENVRLGLERLRSFPWIAEAIQAGALDIHGWHFNIKNGSVSKVTADGSQPL